MLSAIGDILGTIAILAMIGVAWIEVRLKHHRDSRFPEGRFKLVARALQPRHVYTPRGQVLRVRSWQLSTLSLALLLVGSIAKCAGG